MTKDFARRLEKCNAPPAVLEMINKGTFALPDSDACSTNISDFLTWFYPDYYAMIDKEIGWRKLPTELWPGKEEAKIFIKRIVQFAPELTDEDDFGLYSSTWKRFYNDTRKRKPKLGIFPRQGNTNSAH